MILMATLLRSLLLPGFHAFATASVPGEREHYAFLVFLADFSSLIVLMELAAARSLVVVFEFCTDSLPKNAAPAKGCHKSLQAPS